MDKIIKGAAPIARARGLRRTVGTAVLLALSALSLADVSVANAIPGLATAETESMLAVRPHDIVLGPAQAPVTLITYTEHWGSSEFAPWISSWRPLRQKYGNNLRIIVRDCIVASHIEARLTAHAAHGVFELKGEKAYLDFVESLASSQSRFGQQELATAAARVGAGPAEEFAAALDSDRWLSRVEVNQADAKAAMFEETPTTLINGQKLRELSTLATLTAAIDAELKATKALEVKKGLHGAQLSQERTRVNLAANAESRKNEAALGVKLNGDNAPVVARPAADARTAKAEPSASKGEAELPELIEAASRSFCQQPSSTQCQILTKFRQGQLPKVTKSEVLSLGALYTDSAPQPNLLPYFVLQLRPQGANFEALSINITPDNDAEKQQTESYIQSIRAGRRDPASTMHKFLSKEIVSHGPPLKAQQQSNAILLTTGVSPGGMWVRQYKNEWIVLQLAISRMGYRMFPVTSIAALPIE